MHFCEVGVYGQASVGVEGQDSIYHAEGGHEADGDDFRASGFGHTSTGDLVSGGVVSIMGPLEGSMQNTYRSRIKVRRIVFGEHLTFRHLEAGRGDRVVSNEIKDNEELGVVSLHVQSKR